ncbi:hypothetical protein EI94DRAFT_1729980 [Lactarius quietus]|nr:hypothetical protein EI94DRAFT_1729980 [Lactarius quietus]
MAVLITVFISVERLPSSSLCRMLLPSSSSHATVVTHGCRHKLSPFVVSNRVIVAPVIVWLSSGLGLGPGDGVTVSTTIGFWTQAPVALNATI